jgi:hypothetical protein
MGENGGGSRMKSHIIINRKMQEDLCSAVWKDTEKCINTNGALMIIALARHAGWRKKRLEAFINECNKVQNEFHKYELDGTFEIMFEKALDEIGLDVTQLLSEPIDFTQELSRKRKEREKANAPISKSEAARLRRQLQGYKNYVEGESDDRGTDSKA